jgi:alkylation response protein AidB-like acyl-CoA dehydrogenase
MTADLSDFGYGPDEALLRDQARKLLDEYAGRVTLRKLVGKDPAAVYARGELPGYDEGLWRKCVDLGWTALMVPETCGGIDAKMVGVVGLAEEAGKHAFPSPLLATLTSSAVLREASSPAAKRWLHKIAAGTGVSLALTGQRGSWELDQTDVEAERTGGALSLRGGAYFVQDAFKVDAFLVTARSGEGVHLAVVRADAPGLTLARDHIVDLTHDQGHIVLKGVKVSEEDIVASAPHGGDLLRKAWPRVLTLVSADLVGASAWLLETTVEYAKVRKQFDRSLGFFQAVKHPLVNAMMEIDLARSHLYHAALCIDSASEQAEVAARMTKSAASDAASFMAGRAVQLHGGIGFTWECDVHFYFKRNGHHQALYGDGVHQRKKLAELMIGPVGLRFSAPDMAPRSPEGPERD